VFLLEKAPKLMDGALQNITCLLIFRNNFVTPKNRMGNLETPFALCHSSLFRCHRRLFVSPLGPSVQLLINVVAHQGHRIETDNSGNVVDHFLEYVAAARQEELGRSPKAYQLTFNRGTFSRYSVPVD